MKLRLFIVSLVALLFLAGCIGVPGDDDEEDEEPNGEEVEQPPWPDLEDAEIRPGVRAVSDAGSCTSNFVFKSPDNSTLYLGLAAHCLQGEEEGERVEIAGGVATGTVAYNSWYTMEQMDGNPGVSTSTNDFALVEIPGDKRHLVHPAVYHYGGPVGLVERAEPGDRVITYGNTPLRQGVEPSNSREGYVVEASDWYTSMYIVTPGVPGDSGSGVLTGHGEALGVLIHLGLTPLAASNGAVNLVPALSFAEEHGGVEAELATWEVLDPGVFPDPE